MDELKASFVQGFATPEEVQVTAVTATIGETSVLGRECLRSEGRDILP